MAKYMHKCEQCSREFYNNCKETKFCSRNCYDKYRIENRKLKELTCPICNKLFRQTYSNQIFCSVECRIKSTEKQIECKCDCCGKLFYRKKSEVNRNTRHYCSKECKIKGMWWSDEDTAILQNNYGKISYKEMVNLFSTPKTVGEIKSRAIYIGITSSIKWTDEETQTLIENYSVKPMFDVMNLLPSRSQSSILGKARSLGLKSYFYLNRVYTEEENQYLKDNYLNKSNEELAIELNRNSNGIAQHLCVLKLYRPKSKDGYNDLSEYIRGRLIPWIKQIKRENNFTCSLTGSRTNIVIHHIRGFNLILNEAIEQISFPIYDNISDYSEEQLEQIFITFYNLQELYKSYTCLTSSVHKQFHSIYGYGDNTEEQWNDFVSIYY